MASRRPKPRRCGQNNPVGLLWTLAERGGGPREESKARAPPGALAFRATGGERPLLRIRDPVKAILYRNANSFGPGPKPDLLKESRANLVRLARPAAFSAA